MVGAGERREGFGRLLIEIKSRKKLFGEDTVKYSGTMGEICVATLCVWRVGTKKLYNALCGGWSLE